jgi:lipopolysaccharide export system permease protein
MLFHSSIRRELGRSFTATFVVLITVIMTILLIRTLGQATRGSVNPSDVMIVLGYTVLGHLPTILTLSLFIAIVSSLSRMYADSEMVIWFTAGRGLSGFIAPLMRFAWPILLAIAALSLVVWPWSNAQVAELKERFEQRGDLERVAPGQFQESAGGSRVFFIDKDPADSHTGKNVFVYANEKGKETLTSARSGRVDLQGADRFLLLENGQRLESQTGKNELRVSEFAEYGVKVDNPIALPADTTPVKARSSLALLLEPTLVNQGELSWRLGLSLAAINFVLIALAVSSVNPRAGRSGNLLLALFAFIVYYNLINIGNNWIFGGKASFAAYMLWLHGSALLLAMLWLAKRHHNWSLRSALRAGLRRSAAKSLEAL